MTTRQSEILQWVRNDDFVSIEGLSTHFEVSPQTIRRDVNLLSDRGLLRRQHGGVGLPSSFENMAYESREVMQAEEKRGIAKVAASLIPDYASLFIGIGTTAAEVARALVDHDGLRVVTNNLNVAELLCRNSSFEVILAGGKARNRERDFIGETAMSVFRDIRTDFGILGAGGIDADGALRDFDFDEVRMSRLILENSNKPLVVADHTKFNRAATVRFAALHEIHTLITNAPVSSRLADLAEQSGVEVLVARRGGRS
ncbi:MAG: DeoR/GlpR transcriptional regulator [Rhodospirillaceae bacterium]|nr:DeoR/GlpR transcriptional regulator [Rhodospirillaceae bacterium]